MFLGLLFNQRNKGNLCIKSNLEKHRNSSKWTWFGHKFEYIFKNVLRLILSHKSYNLKGCATLFYIIPLRNFSMNSFKNTWYFCFFRSYTLPRGCKSEDVTSNLSADGVLMITAAKKKSIQEASRKVPIEMKKWFSQMFQYFSLYH